MRNTLSFGTLPFHWKTGPTPPQEHTFPGVRGKIQQQIRPLLGMLGWANLPSLTDSTSFPLHPQVWGWGWGGGLPAKADLYQGLELSWVRGREPRVSPPSNQCLKAEVRVCLCQKYPSPPPFPQRLWDFTRGRSPGWQPRPICNGDHRREEERFGRFGRQFENIGSLQRALSSIPACGFGFPAYP